MGFLPQWPSARREKDMKIYIDTCCLPSNIPYPDAKSLKERAALDALEQSEQCSLFGSRRTLLEVMNTANQSKQNSLIVDYKALQSIPKDEKLLGFNHQSDQYGFICHPLIQDCQDEAMRKKND